MREIKFRVWDTRDKKMLRFAVGILNTLTNSFSDGRLIFLQYTELKDKRAKEIYEGDIVKTDNHNGIHFFAVKYIVDSGGSLGAFEFVSNEDNVLSVHCEAINNGEVIGNIYENPELLEEK